MKQSPGEVAGIPGHDDPLPCLQLDPAQVLPARGVLRQETRPVPGVARPLGAARPLLRADLVARPDRAHRSHAFLDQPGPGVRAYDAQFPYPLVAAAGLANAAVSQIKAQQVRVIGLGLGAGRGGRASGAAGPRVRGPFGMLAPVAQRSPVHPGRHANAAETESAFHERDRIRRSSELYITRLWQAALTKPAPKM